jgi:hypothetical protein
MQVVCSFFIELLFFMGNDFLLVMVNFSKSFSFNRCNVLLNNYISVNKGPIPQSFPKLLRKLKPK